MQQVILASQSPRRKQLLEQAEIEFMVLTAHTDEDFPSDMNKEEVPLFIARNKAQAVWQQRKDGIIIAADTVVILDNQIIGKPVDEADARRILKNLSGRTHCVITGAVIQSAERVLDIREKTEVTFRVLTDSQIAHYIKRYQPFDKAGAYAIQEWIGLIGIEKINGDFYNVMGLPISRITEGLKSFIEP